MKISKDKIDILAAERSLTGYQLAERGGFSRQQLSTVRTRGTCTAAFAVKIACALGVDVTELLPDKEN